jgi:hypothetical protein
MHMPRKKRAAVRLSISLTINLSGRRPRRVAVLTNLKSGKRDAFQVLVLPSRRQAVNNTFKEGRFAGSDRAVPPISVRGKSLGLAMYTTVKRTRLVASRMSCRVEVELVTYALGGRDVPEPEPYLWPFMIDYKSTRGRTISCLQLSHNIPWYHDSHSRICRYKRRSDGAEHSCSR